VSAGNSQRNSRAVSECREELDNAVILSRTTRPSPETSPSAPHETPNMQPQYAGREWRPCHVRPRWRMDWSSVLLPDRSLRCQSMKNTRRRGCVNKRHIINTTSLRPSISQNTSHHAEHRTHLQTSPSPPLTTRRHVDTSKITFRASRNTPHAVPVREKGVAPLSCTPLDGRWTSALHLPARQ